MSTLTTKSAVLSTYFYKPSNLILHDAPQVADEPWEDFTELSLWRYYGENIKKFKTLFQRIEDLAHECTPEQDAELLFMLESLLQARRTLRNR